MPASGASTRRLGIRTEPIEKGSCSEGSVLRAVACILTEASRRARSGLLAVALKEQPQPLQDQEVVNLFQAASKGGDRLREAARRDAPRAAAKLCAQAPDHGVNRAREAVDHARADRLDRRLADQRPRRDRDVNLRQRPARSVSASSAISRPGMMIPPRYSPCAETGSKVIAVPKSTTMHAPLKRS